MRVLIIAGWITALFFLPLTARENVDVGLTVGSISGAGGKAWLSNENAVDMAVGSSDGAMSLKGDYLWHDAEALRAGEGELLLYYGLGGYFKGDNSNRNESDNSRLAVRAPVGMEYRFEDAPAVLFGDIALAAGSWTGLLIQLGVRYRF